MKFFVTGATGFIGRNLCSLLREEGDAVCGTTLENPGNSSGLNAPSIKAQLYHCDITDKAKLKAALEAASPDAVVHLAAQAYVRKSWQDPRATFDTNILGTLNLFEAALELGTNPSIVSATSSIMYQTAKPPFKESDALVPSNPYGLSKIAADHLGTIFSEQYGLKIVNARIFPTTGPGKTGDAPNDFASKLAEIHLGLRPPRIEVERLGQKRDLLHVKDNVRALKLLAQKGVKGKCYNVCRGEAIGVKQMLEQMISFTGKKVEVVYDEARIRERGKDAAVVLGDPSKINALGWKPRYGYENLFKEIFDYWIGQYEKN